MKKENVKKDNVTASQLQDYINQLNQQDEGRTSFYDYFDGLQKDFYVYLKTKYDKETAFKHKDIIGMLKLYLSGNTKIGKAEEITPDMVGNVFYEWYNRNVLDDLTKKEIRLTLKIFFNYLKEEKKIINQGILDSLK